MNIEQQLTALGFKFEREFKGADGNTTIMTRRGKLGNIHAQIDPDGTVNGIPASEFIADVKEGRLK
jgi:hypothetical protein